ncbi:MAG: ribokinase [Myxococcota bacterium]
MRDIVVVGSLNVDVSLVAERLPRPGETVRGEGLAIGPGGKGLNQAVAAARLGGRVHMVGSLGDDVFAEIPERMLRGAGIECSAVQRLPEQSTGTAAIVIDRTTRQNQIAVASGANRALSIEQVRDAIHLFRQSRVLLVQLEAPLETVAAALAQARTCNLVRVLDPAPVPLEGDLDDALLREVDILTPNEREAEQLSGIAVHDVESAARAGARLQERTLGDVVVTLGADGCVWTWASGFEHVPAPTVAAVDTTGAGDAFNGGLAVALARGERLPRALVEAVYAGSAATCRRGAAEAMPTRAQLEQMRE